MTGTLLACSNKLTPENWNRRFIFQSKCGWSMDKWAQCAVSGSTQSEANVHRSIEKIIRMGFLQKVHFSSSFCVLKYLEANVSCHLDIIHFCNNRNPRVVYWWSFSRVSYSFSPFPIIVLLEGLQSYSSKDHAYVILQVNVIWREDIISYVYVIWCEYVVSYLYHT